MATPSKTTTPRRAVKAAPTPTVVEGEIVHAETTPPADTRNGRTTATIEFEGRTLLVARPEIEQLAMYRRIATQMQALRHLDIKGPAEGERVVKLFDRAALMIESVLVEPDDREWVQDLLLAGRKITDLMPILHKAIEQTSDKTAAKTTTGPRGRARRTR